MLKGYDILFFFYGLVEYFVFNSIYCIVNKEINI